MAGRNNRRDVSMLMERWEDIQVVWRLLLDRKVDLSLKLIPLLAVIYLISPIDLLPDLLIGPGQLDDIGIILLALTMFLRLAPSDRVAEARQQVNSVVSDATARVKRVDEDQ